MQVHLQSAETGKLVFWSLVHAQYKLNHRNENDFKLSSVIYILFLPAYGLTADKQIMLNKFTGSLPNVRFMSQLPAINSTGNDQHHFSNVLFCIKSWKT